MKANERISDRFYRGIWGILSRWFCVPRHPPAIPTAAGEQAESFQPAEAFLRYLVFQFLIGAGVLSLVVLGTVIVCLAALIMMDHVILQVVGVAIVLIVVVLMQAVSYLAIHLRYDTTWYVITPRSLRIRRGIWIIHEMTITYENIQNVTVNQGPLQHYFGIADVFVETAGGGAVQASQAQAGAMAMIAHRGLIEGVADASRIRDLIMNQLEHVKTTGLGDDRPETESRRSFWTGEHISVLREMRDLAKGLAEP